MKYLIKKINRRLRDSFPLLVEVIRLIRQKKSNPITVGLNGEKKALICYITKPFLTNDHKWHSNQKEVIVIAETLEDLDYSVDVVDYNSCYDIDYKSYDLLIGFGLTYAKSFSDANFTGKRILHLTGANPNFSNRAEAERAQRLHDRKGVYLVPRREVYWPWMYSAINSDAIFILGNTWTLSTYDGLNNNVRLIPVPYVSPPLTSTPQKNWNSAKHRFCWFAGSGALHKGLDLVLDALDSLSNCFHVDVCGPIESETDFLTLYEDALFKNPKVTFHGIVDVESQLMRTILATNAYVIFPSCSEGGGSSVVTCMAAGLIPIVTKEASVEIGDFGLLIDSLEVSAVASAMNKASMLDNDELKNRSDKAAKYARNSNSYEKYRVKLRESIVEVIS